MQKEEEEGKPLEAFSERESELLKEGYVSKGPPFWKKDGKLFELRNDKLIEVLESNGGPKIPDSDFRPGNQLEKRDVFAKMDRMDEEQILAELKGEVLEQMVYVVGKGQNRIKSLSWAGVKTVALSQAAKGQPISIEDVKVNETEKGYTAMAVAKNLKTGECRWGVAEQRLKMEVKERGPDGRPTGKMLEVDDPFALPKVFSKAQRNAMRALLPETEVATMIDTWLQEHGRNRR
jgi:hypothetical protein